MVYDTSKSIISTDRMSVYLCSISLFYITHIDVFESDKSELVLYCVRRNDKQAAENYNPAAVLYKVFF